ncbi:MAG TPA: hypothetical protein PKA00_04745 [Saprospiraceae bacterium]|nr:hypothetical protein [Saprospiraceae bacterium]HMQ82189.1 hypothetical protein [Saprospiraceae bacterium]
MKLYLSSLFFLWTFSSLAQGDLCPCMLQDDPIGWEVSAPNMPPEPPPLLYQITVAEPEPTDEPIFIPAPINDPEEMEEIVQVEKKQSAVAKTKHKKSKRFILPKRKHKLRRYSGQCPAF